jgi:DNA-binding NtrC family response regulator
VLEAESGERALELLGREPVDLVFSDVRMPGMSGVELLRRVRSSHPEIPVVLMTAFTTEENVQEAVREGVFTVLAKPFDMQAAVSAVSRALKRPVVLVVDHVENSAEATAAQLRARGLRVSTTRDGDQALELLCGGVADVCIAELDHGAGAGPPLVERIRAAAPWVAVIVCVSRDAVELARKAARAGAYCVCKPVVYPELVRLIAEARGQPAAMG